MRKQLLTAGAWVLLALSATAQADVDRSFGDNGFVKLDFLARGSEPRDDDDRAILACAGPDNSLVVVGLASKGRRIVTAWLTESGQLDENFSGDGKESFDVADGFADFGATGACLPDGGLLIAYEHYDGSTTGDGNIQVVRIHPRSGLPDPSFGTNGTVVVDLDQHATGLGPYERPVAINFGAGGDVLLTGNYSPPGSASAEAQDYAGFFARISATGSVRGVALAHSFDPNLRRFSAAGAATDGTFWVAAWHWPRGSAADARVIRLHGGDDPYYLDSPFAPVTDFNPYRGVLLEGREFVLAGDSAAASPVMAAIRAGRSQRTVLPSVPNVNLVYGRQVASLPDGDLLFMGVPHGSTPPGVDAYFRGAYLARVARSSNGTLRPVPSYGHGGALVATFAAPADCPMAALTQIPRRFTYWRGRPTVVGYVDRGCDGANPDNDYLVLRLSVPMLGDGFE